MEQLGKGINFSGNKINNNEHGLLSLHSERYSNSFFYLLVKIKKKQTNQGEWIFMHYIAIEPEIFAVQYAMDVSSTMSSEYANSY